MAQITSVANNKEARNALVDVKFLLEDIDDIVQSIDILNERFGFYKPAVVLVEKIGKCVEDAKSAMMLDGKDIYNVLEDTKLRDVEVTP